MLFVQWVPVIHLPNLSGKSPTAGSPGGCFTNLSRALQSILSKFVYCGNSTCYANFKLKLCTCAQSYVLGTRTKFVLEILTIIVIFGIVYFRDISLESLRNVSETTPRMVKEWTVVIPQSHHTPRPRMGCFRAVLDKNRTSTHRSREAPRGAVRTLPPRTGPVEF